MTLVTLSASYGAGGSQIGPELARRLEVPFVDRAIPTGVAERLAVPLAEAIARDDAVRSTLERLLRHFAPAAQAFSGAAPPIDFVDDRSYLAATEQVIRERAAGGSAVILGRAGAVVLSDEPRALHVRLDGPQARRIEQAMRIEHVDRETAQRRMKETDRAREAYVQQFYGIDPRDPSLYHLLLDSTAIALDACVELIALAASARADAAS
jgi:cytidylate kinase